MKEKINALLEKVPIQIVGIAILVWFAWGYYQYRYTPEGAYLSKVNEIKEVQAQTDQTQKKLTELKAFISRLETKRTELRGMAQRLVETKASIGDTLDIPLFMQMVVTEAKKIGLTVTTLKPTDKKDKEYYEEQNFELGFRGLYVQAVVFLARLTQLQTLIGIDNLKLHPQSLSGLSGQTGYVTLEGNVTVKGYHYLKSTADELPRPIDMGTPANSPKASPGKPGGGA